MTESEHWLLAYDATCGTCRRISRLVANATGDRLRVVPLGRPDITELRTLAFGDRPPWAPTLLRQDTDASAHGWTGVRMAWPLLRHLGPRITLRVVSALGRYRDPAGELPASAPRDRSWSTVLPARLALGALTAAGLLLAGKPPIAAANEHTAAARWAARHHDRLPTDYAEVLNYPRAYQQAIFAASPPRVQSQLWIGALEHDRAQRPDLTAGQARVFDDAIALAAHEQILRPETRSANPDLDQRLTQLRAEAARHFDSPRNYRLIAALCGTL